MPFGFAIFSQCLIGIASFLAVWGPASPSSFQQALSVSTWITTTPAWLHPDRKMHLSKYRILVSLCQCVCVCVFKKILNSVSYTPGKGVNLRMSFQSCTNYLLNNSSLWIHFLFSLRGGINLKKFIQSNKYEIIPHYGFQ